MTVIGKVWMTKITQLVFNPGRLQWRFWSASSNRLCLFWARCPGKITMGNTCSVPMWLLCDDALVSCPQRDTIQTVSSSALLHRLCRSLSRILEKKKTAVSHVCITCTLRCSGCWLTVCGLMPTSSQSFGLAVRGGQLEKSQSLDLQSFNWTPLLC